MYLELQSDPPVGTNLTQWGAEPEAQERKEPKPHPDLENAVDGSTSDVQNAAATGTILTSLRTRDQFLQFILLDYLRELKKKNASLTPEEVAGGAVEDINLAIRVRNNSLPKGEKDEKWKFLDALDPPRIAACCIGLNHVKRIQLNNEDDEKSYVLGIYERDGPNRGIYNIDEDAINALCRRYNSSLRKSDISEIKAVLMDTAPIASRLLDPNLIPVNNGIFDYKKKRLIPFSPEYVFTSKCGTDYNPIAANPVIINPDGTKWDVVSWMESLVDHLPDKAEMTELLWKITGAMVRYLVPWDKAVFLISPKGNNGKGTLCELLRSLLGKGNYANIPITNFGKDFMLEPLTHVNAILTDENDVGTYVDSVGNLKAIITGDQIQLNRKYKPPITFRFRGFMLQCLNDYPNYRDKSDSLNRRQLCVPMTKCFTGEERRYIKADYVHRKEVLQYVLFKVLNMDYDQLPEPESCKCELDKSKEMNDPVLQFMNEVMGVLVWDLVPYTFLYDLYKSWYGRNVPGKSPLSRNRFIDELKRNLPSFPAWTVHQDENRRDLEVRSKGNMEFTEPLIVEYGLDAWTKSNYAGRNVDIKCYFSKKEKYRGIIRVPENEDLEEKYATRPEDNVLPEKTRLVTEPIN